jgi:uncharacterized protein (DUF302 family)
MEMQQQDLYRTESSKPVARFADDLKEVAAKYGFVVHNAEKMALAEAFARHNVPVAPGFDLHMIQLCKPEKAAQSMGANPERSVLMPKFVMAFSGEGKTQIRFLRYNAEEIAAVVGDPQFPASLAETYGRIVAMIEEAR